MGGSEVPRAAAAAAPDLATCPASQAVAGGGTPLATAAAAPATAQGGAAAAPAPPSASARFVPLTERVTEQQYKAVLKQHNNGGRAVLDRHHYGLKFNVVALHNAVVDQGGYVEVRAGPVPSCRGGRVCHCTGCGLHIHHSMPGLLTAAAAAAAPGCAPLRSEPVPLPCLPCPAPSARLWPLLSPLPSLLWTQQVRPAPLHCPASWLVAQRAAGGLCCSCAVCMHQRRALHWLWAAQPVVAAGSLHLSTPSGFLLITTSHR